MKAYVILYGTVLKETGPRNRANPDHGRQILTEFKVIVISKLRDIHKNIICSLRHGMPQTDPVKPVYEKLPLSKVFVLKASVIFISKT